MSSEKRYDIAKAMFQKHLLDNEYKTNPKGRVSGHEKCGPAMPREEEEKEEEGESRRRRCTAAETEREISS